MKIVAVTNYRFDSDYLEDWKRNLRPLVDDFVTVYDKDGSLFKDESKARRRLYDLAVDKGADWIAVIDPDERIEKGSAKRIRKIIENLENQGSPRAALKFSLRELYKPNAYRVDGIWGKKEKHAIFSVKNDNIFSDAKLHVPREPQNDDLKVIDTGYNIYHLKHIKPELRKHRKEIYNKLDPNGDYQSFGYNYLDDESGMELCKISFSRRYLPRYRDYKIDKEMFEI